MSCSKCARLENGWMRASADAARAEARIAALEAENAAMRKDHPRVKQILVWMEHTNLRARMEMETGDGWLSDHTAFLRDLDRALEAALAGKVPR